MRLQKVSLGVVVIRGALVDVDILDRVLDLDVVPTLEVAVDTLGAVREVTNVLDVGAAGLQKVTVSVLEAVIDLAVMKGM